MIQFTRDVVARLRGSAKNQVIGQRRNPYEFPTYPPGVVPEAGTLANDAALSARASWANDAALSIDALGGGASYGLAWANGYGFMGYAYLAQLAQVAEYRQLVDTLAEEMVREWIEIKAVGSDKKASKVRKLTQRMNDDLGLREASKKFAQDDGYFGVGHLYLDTGQTEKPDELKTTIGNGRDAATRAKEPQLKRLQNVEALWCYPTGYDTTNPLREDWYRPTAWYVNGIETHRSRLLTGSLRQVPDILKPAYAFGGLALTQLAKPYVENWLRTRQSVADIIWRYTVNVLMTDLQTLLQSAGDADNIVSRVQALNQVMNTNGTLVLNKSSEDFKNVSAPIAGLHELQAQSQEHMAAVGREPLVKMFGIQPSGLNASSDGEIRMWYDTVHGCQTNLLGPVVNTVLWFTQMEEYGEVDPDIRVEWRPLGQLDGAARATVQQTRAQTHGAYVEMGAVTPEEVREALSTDPESPYAGLELSESAPQDDDSLQSSAELDEANGENDPAVRLAHHVLDLVSGERDVEAEELARTVLDGSYRRSPAERLARTIGSIALAAD